MKNFMLGRWSGFVLSVLAIALAVHVAALFAVPSTVMALAMKRLSQNGVVSAVGGTNVALIAPRVDHTAREVVRSTPDLLYALCIYDLSTGPIRLQVPKAGGYVSVSLYAENTDNFFVTDDRATDAGKIEVTLMRPGWEKLVDGPNVIASPSNRGIALVRILIEDEARLAAYIDQQNQTRCGPIGAF